MTSIKEFFQQHRALLIVLVVTLFITFAPLLESWIFIGSNWRGIPQAYGDEFLYYAQAHAVAEGHIGFGNPYILEHAADMPIVLFGGTWVSSIPLLFHPPLMASIEIDFIIWGLIFVILSYWLLRELKIPKWLSAFGAVFSFAQCSGIIARMSSRQIVYPSFLLFYIALIRFLKDPNRSNIIFLGLATGSTFWVFSYLWQTAVITLGLLFVYTLIRKNWTLMKATLLASVIGGVIGLPTLLYMLWLSHASPYFWESIARFGLVASHLPEAEVIYSGGWIGIALALLIVLYWRVEALRHNKEFIFASIFLGISGFGMWIMEGSNLVTGQLLENGSHMRPFIVTWLAWATVIIAVLAWQHRGLIGKYMRVLVVCWIGVLVLASGYFLNAHMKAFLFCVNQSLWNTQQLYAAPYAWLQANESKSVVVWGNPHDHSTDELPIFTRDFVLYAQPTLFDLVSNQEIQERYLVSNYFDNPTVDDLKNDLQYYVGRGDAFHHAKTVERGIKICRILYFWDKNKDCGVPPTSIDLIGEKLFNDMEQKFQTDIKPNIKTYLKKYNVSYILKDDVLDPQYHPEKLGGVRVYSDGRFEIYKF